MTDNDKQAMIEAAILAVADEHGALQTLTGLGEIARKYREMHPRGIPTYHEIQDCIWGLVADERLMYTRELMLVRRK